MSINQNIYGTPEQWSNAFFQQAQITTKNKLASFATNAKTLSDGVTAGKLSYDSPIDKSLSYCGLGTESAMSHVVYCGLHDNAFQAYDSTDRNVTNFAFFEKQTNTTYLTQENIWLNELNRVNWSENIDTEWNYTKDLIPYTVVNPHNILLYVSLSVSDGNGVYQYTSLNYFRENYQQHNWSRIARVKLTPYFGNNTDGVAWSASAGYNPTPAGHSLHLGLLDEYVVTTKNKSFYMYENPNFEWIPFGFVGANGIGSLTDTNLVYMCYIPESAKSHIKYDNTHREFYIEYYDDIVEDILKTVACFGLYFCTTTANLGNLTNEYTYIGLIDDDGVGRGRYLQGADTVNAPQAQVDYTDMHNTGYDPSKSIDPNTYYDSTTFPTVAGYTPTEYYVNPISVFHSSAVVSALNELAEIPEPSDQFNWEKLFMWQEPIECIIAWRIIYLKPSYNSTRYTNVKIGWFVTSETSSKMYVNSGEQRRIDLGEKIIFPHFGNCLDYAPYTKMSLYVPFCGSIEIPPSQFMNHKLHLYINVNDRTGEMEVLIMLDNKLWGSMKGNASIEYPLSGSRSMEYIQRKLQIENQITDAEFSGIVGMLGNAAGASISFVHGNPAGSLIQIGSGLVSAMESIDKVARLEYELDHTNNKIVNLQKSSPTVSLLSVSYPFILIQRPQLLPGYSEEIYSKTVGFATLENTYKSNVYGYTEAINPLLDGISCTITEKNLIVEALKNGCIFDEKE